MSKEQSRFEKLVDKNREFYQKILPDGPRKKIITTLVSSFILYTATWITLTLYLISFGPFVIFSLIILMVGISIVTLAPLLSVGVEKIKAIDSQSEEYRRDPKNKGKIFVHFGDEGGWKEFNFSYPDTTKSFKNLAEKAGFDTEMGGEDENQKKTRLRNNKIKNILGDE